MYKPCFILYLMTGNYIENISKWLNHLKNISSKAYYGMHFCVKEI